MYKRSEPPADHLDSYSTSHHTRVILMLVAICCLSIGAAVGAIVSGIAWAKSDDNRLTIRSTAVTPDALSVTFARVARDVEPSVVHIKVYEGEVYAREGAGSGVIVNSAGFILTNAHVVRRANKIRVKLWDTSETDARVVGIDLQTDLAVIKIETNKALPVARMGDSDKLNVGDWVLAMGSPFGLEQTVTAGIISAKDRVTEAGATPFQQFLQTDAAINPGNSGGPLVNLAGEVIGINTQIATSNGLYNGIGFALPSSTAVDVYNQLVSDGRVRRGFLGINPQEITPQIARLNKIPDGQGVLIRELTNASSPASVAGLQSGDVITSINGQKVKNVRELIRRIAALPVGSIASIEYVRAAERRFTNVKLDERKDEAEDRPDVRVPLDPRTPRRAPERQNESPGGVVPKPEGSRTKSGLGINVKTLTPELAKTMGLEGARGAFVTSVEPASIADENGMTADDLILEINNRSVASQEDFLRAARDLKSGDDVVIKVLRKERGPLRRAWIVSFTMP
ncbi:MAG TPA: trypsin-like peptidase domain-containing protein [Blastocatellia bacterium]|nr:trypsin-like peptidase domain-containing protein [Blastocatellia bacterium]